MEFGWVIYLFVTPKEFKQPSDVVAVNINPENGKIATKNCPISVKMYFAKGTEPTEYCMDHVDDKEEFESPSNPTDEILGYFELWKKLIF